MQAGVHVAHFIDDGGRELWLVVGPLRTFYSRRLVGNHHSAVPTVELAAVVDTVVEWKHLTWAVLDEAVMVTRLCWNGHLLLNIGRQVDQLRHAAPVRHFGTEKDDLDGVGAVDGKEKNNNEHSPLVDSNLTNVVIQIALRHGDVPACCQSQQPAANCTRSYDIFVDLRYVKLANFVI